jgi:inorganic triphosphatase YgiF
MTNPPPLEIELKLSLPPQQVDAFRKRMARRRGQPEQQDLVTRYFDTPDFALSAQGVALRVRRVGRRWLQTLKTEGERCGGLSQRVEHEMPIRRGVPDWSRFPVEALAYVPEALRDQLVPVFETRFNRTAWLIRGQSGAQIEVALDVGEVLAGKQSQPICEIELELKAGQPDALFALALDWAGQFDCVPFDISKAERGVRLAHGQAATPARSVPLSLNRDMSVEAGFAAMVQACLTQFQANLPGALGPLKEPLAIRLSPQADKSLVIPIPDETSKAALNKLVCCVVRQAHHERNQPLAVRPEPVEGLVQRFPNHSTKPASGQVAAYPPQAGEGANAEPQPINDIEYVHQARVALRRLRAVLRVFRRACALPDELMEGLHELMAALGPARDWDVLCCETLPRMAAYFSDPVAWQQGLDRLEAQRADIRAAMRSALLQAQPGAWLLACQRWLWLQGWQQASQAQRPAQLSSLKKWARRALHKGHRSIERSAGEYAQLQMSQRHALRIAIKRQRYTAEFFLPLLGGRRQARYLAALQALQDSMGRSNDARVAWELLTQARMHDAAMGQFALGWLAARQAENATDEIVGQLQKLMKSGPDW